MSILVHSSAIPVHSCGFLPIHVDSSVIPVDSSGMYSFLQESVGHGEVLAKCLRERTSLIWVYPGHK